MAKSVSKYENLSKPQLISRLEKLERERYGLVWEDKEEDVAKQCEIELPVLKEDHDKEIVCSSDLPYNYIIEGDNYHSLYTLNFTHKKKIDVIYIDPPYNTGATDWKYNNKYIDPNDPYSHSKWLSFMSKRLKLAKRLLKDDGIICVTIDDYEMPRLFILMEKIFGEKNRLGTIVIRSNPSGRSTLKGISVTHEYALIFSKSDNTKLGRLSRTEKQISRYDEKDNIGNFEWVNFRKHGGYKYESPKMYYPIFINIKKKSMRIPKVEWDDTKKEWLILEKEKVDEVIIFPKDEDGRDRRWKWNIERAKAEASEMKIGLDRNKKPAVYIKSRLKDEGILPLTWWDKAEYSATAYGTNLLKTMFSDIHVFSYPKSIYAVKDCLLALTDKKNALILDFFAGSGTTGHAVLELNKEDEGSRQFILCTNNENNICEKVTYPRIKKVIKGYADKEGIPANVKYFKQTFVPNIANDKDKRELVNRSTELLCMAENTFEEIIKRSAKSEFAIFKNANKQTAIIYDEEGIEKCVNKLNSLKSSLKTVIYVFSYDHTYEEEDFENVKIDFSVKPIPEAILNIYRKIAKMRKK